MQLKTETTNPDGSSPFTARPRSPHCRSLVLRRPSVVMLAGQAVAFGTIGGCPVGLYRPPVLQADQRQTQEPSAGGTGIGHNSSQSVAGRAPAATWQVPGGNMLQPTSSLTHQYNPLGQSTHSCWPGGAYLPAGQTAGECGEEAAAARAPGGERRRSEVHSAPLTVNTTLHC